MSGDALKPPKTIGRYGFGWAERVYRHSHSCTYDRCSHHPRQRLYYSSLLYRETALGSLVAAVRVPVDQSWTLHITIRHREVRTINDNLTVDVLPSVVLGPCIIGMLHRTQLDELPSALDQLVPNVARRAGCSSNCLLRLANKAEEID